MTTQPTIKTESGDKKLKRPIRPDILELLRNHTAVDENGVKFTCGQLDRPIYEAADEVLGAIGGKWSGKRKMHLFPFDVTALFAAVLEAGMMPEKNPLAFFPTPRAVGDELVSMVEEYLLPPNPRILEPSAGQGALVDALRYWAGQKRIVGADSWQIDCCEMDPLNRRVLENKSVNLVGANFLEYQPEQPYDLIAMNPPFSVDGDKKAWITHIEHAWGMLAERGQIVVIIPFVNAGNNRRVNEFLGMVRLYGELLEHEQGAFKESGTGVKTAQVWLKKQDVSWMNEPYEGWPNYRLWEFFLMLDNQRETVDAVHELWAKKPERAEVIKFLREMQRHKEIEPYLKNTLTEADLEFAVDEIPAHYELEPLAFQAAVTTQAAPQLELFA